MREEGVRGGEKEGMGVERETLMQWMERSGEMRMGNEEWGDAVLF